MLICFAGRPGRWWIPGVPKSARSRIYQEEIGLRHTPAKKNVTDDRNTPPLVPLRYLLGFLPVVFPIHKFFADAIQNEEELKNLQDAWTKAVILHVTLWTRPYASHGLW
jgi:hypothetical protein